jgi:hypothetical protein
MAKSRRRIIEATGRGGNSPDEQEAQAVTIAWIASVTSVLMADLATIAAHFYFRFHPESKTAPLFAAIMLLTACLLGVASLALLAAVWRTSRLKPPKGFVAFAVIIAAAPIVTTICRLLQN